MALYKFHCKYLLTCQFSVRPWTPRKQGKSLPLLHVTPPPPQGPQHLAECLAQSLWKWLRRRKDWMGRTRCSMDKAVYFDNCLSLTKPCPSFWTQPQSPSRNLAELGLHMVISLLASIPTFWFYEWRNWGPRRLCLHSSSHRSRIL